ncbi:MAG: hypothetical protein WCA46_15160 [Actinocatenispora sp.]
MVLGNMPDSTHPQRLLYRIEQLEHEAAADARVGRYTRFYPPMALLLLVLSFQPLLAEDPSSSEFGSVWHLAGRYGGPALTGVLLFVVLVALLVLSSLHGRVGALPVLIAVFSVPIILLLVAKPETGHPSPDLSDSGLAGLVLTSGLFVLAVAHAVHVGVWRRRDQL